jgi:hypothetical protein
MFKNLFKKKQQELPWIIEGKKVFGLHEGRDKTALTTWLKSDGQRLGDVPRSYPGVVTTWRLPSRTVCLMNPSLVR